MNNANDILLSPIVAGLWRLEHWAMNAMQLANWIEQALALGITSFDHADVYGSYTEEAQFGRALASVPGLRNRLQLVTKCGIRAVSAQRPEHRSKSYDSSARHIVASVEASLRDLQTDRIDLLLLHRPDLLMDPDEVAEAFTELRATGKVLRFGVSNHTPGQVAMLHRRFPLETNQIEFSALQMQALADGTLEQCTDLALQPMIWSPLAGGRLHTGQDAQAQRVRSVLGELANSYGVSVSTVAYAWILRHPSRPIPVTGSHRIEALREAMAARAVAMTGEDWYRVWQSSMGQEVA